MSRSLKTFAAGLLLGVFLTVGAGFAQENTVPATVSRVRFILGGEEISAGERPDYYFNGRSYVPTSLNYGGTTYVPVRFIAEVLGLHVTWDQTTRSIILGESKTEHPRTFDRQQTLPLVLVDPEKAPDKVREVLTRSLGFECAQSLTVGDSTYLIVTRGEKPTAGYTVEIESAVDNGYEIVVTVKYVDPAPGAIVAQVITYPHIVAAIPKAEKPIRFQGAGVALDAYSQEK
jgi:hypothetical protein